MSEQITPQQFHAAAGVEDWRVVGEGACAYFRTGSFAAGARLVEAIARLESLDEHQPDVDVRFDGVMVRLVSVSADNYGLSRRDVELAQQISAVAREQGVTAEPNVVQTVQVTIDALDIPTVKAFWRAVLGYQDRADSPEDLVDPLFRGTSLWFQHMDAPRPQRNRIHFDVWVAHDQAEARIAAALAAGGHLVSDANAPTWWVLADPEGNEACIATWLGRD
jgi:4a-hydroxytetrahydrobiopterin dehydratase